MVEMNKNDNWIMKTSWTVSSTMGRLRSLRPRTPGQRHVRRLEAIQQGVLWSPKALRVGKQHSGGRNHTGHITAFHRGGGRKTVLRQVEPIPQGHHGRVLGIQWDPQRTAPIALMCDLRTQKIFYTLAGEGMTVGSILTAATDPMDVKPNTRCTRSMIPRGGFFYDLSLDPMRPFHATAIKAAGTHGQLLAHGEESLLGRTRIRFPSGEERWVDSDCYATRGTVGASDHRLESLGKAGTRRRQGIRPTVRGCAMNPIDHPHGGRTKGGRHDVTPWAKIAKGQPTRSMEDRSPWVVKTSRQSRGRTSAS